MVLVRQIVTVSLLAVAVPVLAARTGPIAIEDLNSPMVTVGDYDTGEHSGSASNTGADGGGLIVLMEQLQEYQQQLSSLQGQIEELHHQMSKMQSSAKDRYLDLDTRLGQLEQEGGASSTEKEKRAATSSSNDDADAATSQSSLSPEDAAKDSEAYLAARNKILSEDRQSAIDALDAYLQNFPKGQHAADAHYWLAEVYRLKGDGESLQKADTEFHTFISRYPNDSKLPTALYKLANVSAQQGKTDDAKALLERIIDKYPDSNDAALAKKTLATF